MKYYYSIKYRAGLKGELQGRSSTVVATSVGDALEKVCVKVTRQAGVPHVEVTAITIEELTP